MRKAWNILVLCAVLLTGCGNASEPAVSSETMTVSQTQTEPTESAEKETEPTEDISCEVTETGSDMISSEIQPTVTTTEVPQDAVFSTETTMSISESERETVSSGMNTTETIAPETQMMTKETGVKTTTVTTTAPKPKSTTTTAKQTTTIKTTTTAATTTVTTVTQPPAPPSVVDLNQVSDQMWVFLTEYGIAYDEMYAAGAGLHHDGTDYGKAKAVCEYAYNSGGQNCIEYALNAYFFAKGAGLECYIARSSLYDWYGHVGNVIRLDGKWYYMEPMSNITGSPQTYAAGASYPDGLDIVTDIYENRIQVTISDEWYN